MILPPVDFSGAVVADPWRDARVPGLTRGNEPRPVARYTEPERCGGRHLFDVLESAYEWWDEQGPTDQRNVEFHAVLTCVRCGTIVDWKGTRTGDEHHRWPLDPTPITAGPLVAQQTQGLNRSWSPSGVGDGWTVYADGAAVGTIGWDRTPRGRERYVARLDAWVAGRTFEGPTAIAALRKLARATVSTGAPEAVTSTAP
jgi:hypothetical protein